MSNESAELVILGSCRSKLTDSRIRDWTRATTTGKSAYLVKSAMFHTPSKGNIRRGRRRRRKGRSKDRDGEGSFEFPNEIELGLIRSMGPSSPRPSYVQETDTFQNHQVSIGRKEFPTSDSPNGAGFANKTSPMVNWRKS